jgi:hypothetical protein
MTNKKAELPNLFKIWQPGFFFKAKYANIQQIRIRSFAPNAAVP